MCLALREGLDERSLEAVFSSKPPFMLRRENRAAFRPRLECCFPKSVHDFACHRIGTSQIHGTWKEACQEEASVWGNSPPQNLTLSHLNRKTYMLEESKR